MYVVQAVVVMAAVVRETGCALMSHVVTTTLVGGTPVISVTHRNLTVKVVMAVMTLVSTRDNDFLLHCRLFCNLQVRPLHLWFILWQQNSRTFVPDRSLKEKGYFVFI